MTEGEDRWGGGRRWRLVGAPRLSSRRKPKRGARPPFEPPAGMGCWEDGVRPSPQTPLTGAGGTGRLLVRGRMVWPRGGAGCEGAEWRRDCHPGGSPKGGRGSPMTPRNGNRLGRYREARSGKRAVGGAGIVIPTEAQKGGAQISIAIG